MEGSKSVNVTGSEAHFSFGENWASYAELISSRRIEQAKRDLARLLDRESLAECTFLDIGCGSGLHVLAALLLGAKKVVAIDLDPQSVATTKSMLDRFVGTAQWDVVRADILRPPFHETEFDIVYSWGVLHHTGAMRDALANAGTLVKPGGLLSVAIYRKTPFCGMWRRIKRWYAFAGVERQRFAQSAYIAIFAFALRARGQRLSEYVKDYESRRGMDFYHDVHDWLGGYPYDSIAPEELRELMSGLGFTEAKSFTKPAAAFGILGSGCDEYLFIRRS